MRQILAYGSGTNDTGTAIFNEDRSWEVYENFFNQLSTTNASVFDYKAGSEVDYQMQVED